LRPASPQLQAQLLHNGLADLILDGKNIRQFSIIAFAPEVVAIGNLDELDGDPDPFPDPGKASLQNGGDIEPGPDLPDILLLSAECEAWKCELSHASPGSWTGC
jgi:hypothetical protein